MQVKIVNKFYEIRGARTRAPTTVTPINDTDNNNNNNHHTEDAFTDNDNNTLTDNNNNNINDDASSICSTDSRLSTSSIASTISAIDMRTIQNDQLHQSLPRSSSQRFWPTVSGGHVRNLRNFFLLERFAANRRDHASASERRRNTHATGQTNKSTVNIPRQQDHKNDQSPDAANPQICSGNCPANADNNTDKNGNINSSISSSSSSPSNGNRVGRQRSISLEGSSMRNALVKDVIDSDNIDSGPHSSDGVIMSSSSSSSSNFHSILGKFKSMSSEAGQLNELLQAADKGDIAAIHDLIQSGANLNAKSAKDGATAIHKAAYNNHIEVVRLLYEHGASLDVKNNLGSTPLHYAVNGQATEVVQFLASKGCMVDIRDKYGATPFSLSLKRKYFHIASDLLLFGASIDHKKFDGRTCLHTACEQGDLGVVQFLLEKGAKLNIRDGSAQPPLFTAINNNHPRVVRHLFTNYYKPKEDAASSSGSLLSPRPPSPLSSSPSFDFLASSPVSLTTSSLMTMASSPSTPVSPSRSSSSSSSSSSYSNSSSSSSSTIPSGSPQQQLPYQSLDIKIRDNCGRNIFHVAAAAQSPEIMAIIAEQICRQSVNNNNHNNHNSGSSGSTDEEAAAPASVSNLIRMLVNERDSMTCSTPLHVAVQQKHCHIDVVRILLHQLGSDPNAQNTNGDTPLHTVLLNNGTSAATRKEIARELVMSGARTDIKNSMKITPRHLLRKHGITL